METYSCPNKCCLLKIKQYKRNDTYISTQNRKAGVLLYDPNTNKTLLVQSRGHLWGIPKGTIKYGESERQCAVREVKEETGIDISSDSFTKAIRINRCALYFYMERNECNIDIQDHIVNNDANGIGWIKLECLQKCIENGNIILNQHCRIILERFFNIVFEHPTFTVVKRKNNSKKSKSV